MKKKLKYKYTLTICIIFIFYYSSIQGQDAEFSQFFSNRLYLNPAFAGTYGNTGVNIHFRDQRIQLTSISNTINVSFNQYIEAIKGGIGLQLLNDVQGASISKMQFDAIYSYGIKVTDQLQINAAIQASVFRKRISLSDVKLPEHVNPVGQSTTSYSLNLKYDPHFDFSAGILGNYRSSYFGFAAHHLTKPGEHEWGEKNVDFKIKRKYTFHYGTLIEIYRNGLIKPKYFISPNVVYQIQNIHRINYGLYFLYRNFTFGTWIRQALPENFDAAIILFGIELPKYAIAYSYDFKLPKSGTLINISTHEVTFILNFQYKQKKKIKAIKCPKF